MYVCTYVCMYVGMYVRTVCTYVRMYEYICMMYVFMYVCMNVHISFFCWTFAVTKYSPSTYSQPTTSRVAWGHASGLQTCNICGKLCDQGKGKGKAVSLQTWAGPEVSRKLRFPYFVTTAQDGGKVVSLTHRPLLRPGNTPGSHFC